MYLFLCYRFSTLINIRLKNNHPCIQIAVLQTATVNNQFVTFEIFLFNLYFLFFFQSSTQENNIPEVIEESQTIPSIDVENATDENAVESTPLTNDENHKVTTELTTKSWWSSLVRLFHFGNNNPNEIKPQINNSIDQQSSTYSNGNYLSNVKCRRSIHGDSLVG